MTTCGRPGCNIWGEHGHFDAVNIVGSGHVIDSPYELMEHEIERLQAEVERLRAALAQLEKTSERIARVVGAGPALRGEGEK